MMLVFLAACVETASTQTPRSKAEANVACPPFIRSEPLTPYKFARAQLASLWYARNAVKDALAEMKQAQDADNAFTGNWSSIAPSFGSAR